MAVTSTVDGRATTFNPKEQAWYFDDTGAKVGFEDGTEILDPELKKQIEEEAEKVKVKVEKLRAINKSIGEKLKELSDEFGLKIYMAASSEELDEMGIWKSENVKSLDEMGLAKLVESQF